MSENAIVDDDESETIKSYDTFSQTSQETIFNRFENDGFIMFENIQDESVITTEDSFSLASLESSESNLSGNFIVDEEEEECESVG